MAGLEQRVRVMEEVFRRGKGRPIPTEDELIYIKVVDGDVPPGTPVPHEGKTIEELLAAGWRMTGGDNKLSRIRILYPPDD
ncbi:MAG: hypothetical protein HGB06_04045 [Chlorobaculum sp.]|nr:hypothetical protein [Chlorobaculum sp.]